MSADLGSETATRKRGRPVGADSAETRSRILQAARRVMYRHGYQAATFQAIAVEAGLTRPSVIHYFASREQIYDTLAADGRVVMAECMAAVEGQNTLRTQLSALLSALHAAVGRDRSQIAFLVGARMEGLRNPGLHFQRGAGLNRLLTEMVNAAIARGELPSDTALGPVTDMLQSLMWGMGFYAGFIDSAVDMTPMHALLDRVMSHGLLASAGSTDSPQDTSGDTSGDTPKGVVAQP